MRRRAVQYIVSIITLLGSVLKAGHVVARTGDGQGGHESDQGTRIFGTLDPAVEDLMVPYAPDRSTRLAYDSLSIVDGKLRPTLNGKEIGVGDIKNPLILATTNPNVVFKVYLAQPHTNMYSLSSPVSIWEYGISVENAGVPSPLCNTTTNLALPVPGSWVNKQLAARSVDIGFRFSCLPVIDPSRSSQPSPLVASIAIAREHLAPVIFPVPSMPVQPTVAIRNSASSQIGLNSNTYIMETTRPLFLSETEIVHGGTAAKCIDLGYAPWASAAVMLGQQTVLGGSMPPSDDVTARRFHNVCVQAMTADYAGDGTSHTIAGTIISLFDLTNVPTALCRFKGDQLICTQLSRHGNVATIGTSAPVSSRTLESAQSLHAAPTYDRLLVEGAWFEDGTGNARALCLAKARWQTIDALQFGSTGAPSESSTSVPWGLCDGLELADLVARVGKDTPLLISYSPINERGLWRYQGQNGSITTSHIQVTPQGGFPEPGLPPCATPCVPTFEGDVLAPDAPIADIDPHEPVYLCKNDKGEYATVTRTSAGQLPPGYQFVYTRATSSSNQRDCRVMLDSSFGAEAIPEGYVFWKPPPLPPGRGLERGAQSLELTLWQESPSTFVTASSADRNIAQDKFRSRDGLGYLLFPNSFKLSPQFPLRALQKRMPTLIHFTLPDSPDRVQDPSRGVASTNASPTGSSVAPVNALPAGSSVAPVNALPAGSSVTPANASPSASPGVH